MTYWKGLMIAAAIDLVWIMAHRRERSRRLCRRSTSLRNGLLSLSS